MSLSKRPLADVRGVAAYLNLSIPSIWRGVQSGRLPAPCYPSPAAPRWNLDDVDAALAATRSLPALAKAARREARLALAG